MSKKSVVIALPPRVLQAPKGEKREADSWVNATAAAEQPSPRQETVAAPGMIDLTAARSPVELAWMIWTFPALATLHWMAQVTGQPRPR